MLHRASPGGAVSWVRRGLAPSGEPPRWEEGRVEAVGMDTGQQRGGRPSSLQTALPVLPARRQASSQLGQWRREEGAQACRCPRVTRPHPWLRPWQPPGRSTTFSLGAQLTDSGRPLGNASETQV